MAAAKKPPTPIAETVLSRCPKCESTDRTDYHDANTKQIAGIQANGQPYTQITWRRTACKKCGQRRIDRCFENVVEKRKSKTA